MFPFPIATPQGCNIQTFYGPGVSAITTTNSFTWNKPVGVSHVYMLLIGGGGNGDAASTGGGSGAITVWYGAAQHVPSSLQVSVGDSEDQALIYMYSSASGGRSLLLQANGANSTAAGGGTTPGVFASCGFYNYVNGQGGYINTTVPAPLTFLNSGADSTATINANYGYTAAPQESGYFLMQPIIVGVGGSGSRNGGVGCGGGVTGKGGPAMVLIASW